LDAAYCMLTRSGRVDGMPELDVGMSGHLPLLVRRGVRDIKKNIAKPPAWSGRGGRLQTLFV
jgi:hypothetical protein